MSTKKLLPGESFLSGTFCIPITMQEASLVFRDRASPLFW